MNKQLKIIIVLLGIVILVVATYMITANTYDNRLIKETTEKVVAQEKIKSLVKVAEVREHVLDSIGKHSDQLKTILEYKEKNPEIIIRENDRLKIDINKLDALNSIKLFQDNTDKYIENKDRYSLHRFLKK